MLVYILNRAQMAVMTYILVLHPLLLMPSPILPGYDFHKLKNVLLDKILKQL
jgi:hypothetical protein